MTIKAALIIEVIGRPPEHLTETLEDLIKKISSEKGIKITDKKIHEPALLKETKEFYSSFAEIDIEVEDISNLIFLSFKYMPAHIEIITPESISLSNNNWNGVLNDLLRKLHEYDEVTRIMQMQTAQMQKKLKDLEEKN